MTGTILKSDPGVGDALAPIGTEGWAKRIRLEIEGLVTHLHESPERLGRYLDALVRHQGWTLLNKPDGSAFGSLEEFCVHRRPWGLGLPMAEVARRLELVTTGGLVKALVPATGEAPSEIAITIEQAKALPVHEAATLLPMLLDSELAQLAADIAEHGLRHALVIFDGQLLDGRNRLLACERAGVEPRAITLAECPSPAAYVLSANLHRRHLSESQRAMVGARAKPLFEGEAKSRMLTGKAAGDPKANLPEGRGQARDEAAALVNVSPRSVENAARVLRQGTPELVAAVEAGEVAVSAAVEVAKLPEAEQREVLAQGKAKDVAKEKRAKRAKAEPTPAPPPVARDERPEPPDACPRCGGKRFRYSPDTTHDGQTMHRWVCQAEGCGRVEKPQPKADDRETTKAVFLAAMHDLIAHADDLTTAQMLQLIEASKALRSKGAA